MSRKLCFIILIIAAWSNSGQAQEKEVFLTDLEKDLFKEFTMAKITEFQTQLAIIAGKQEGTETKQVYSEAILDLFINKGKDVIMQVSRISKDLRVNIEDVPIIDYLKKLASLPYARVEMKSVKSCHVSNWYEKGSDLNGNSVYAATATYFQEFVGYKEGTPAYRDVTQKTVEIEIRYTTDLDGARWIILLGDVTVAETNI